LHLVGNILEYFFIPSAPSVQREYFASDNRKRAKLVEKKLLYKVYVQNTPPIQIFVAKLNALCQ